nr:unnamed protein product [Callosobruchus chinensis]
MTDMHFCYGMAQGRPAIVRTIQMEETVLNEIGRNPETSTRKIAHELNITHLTVWQILRHQQLYPYHMQTDSSQVVYQLLQLFSRAHLLNR